MVRAPGGDHDLVVHLVERGLVEPGEQRDPGAQRLLEVDLTAHRRAGDLRDLVLDARVRREHLDHLALDQGRVHVEHDQAHAPTQQGHRLDGDVDALGGRLEGQRAPQPLRIGARDVQVDRGDGVARHPLDPVDVGPAVRDPAGHGGEGRGLQRRAEDGHVRAALATGPVVARPPVDLDGHPEVRGRLLDGVAEPLPVPRGRHQHPEDEPATQHDLLDVEHLDPGPGQRLEDGRRHAGAVLAGQGDQQGPRGVVGVGGGHRGPRLCGAVGGRLLVSAP